LTHPNTPYEQPRTLYETVLTEKQRESLIKNLAGPLSQARRPIQEGFLAHVYKVHPDYGTRLAKAIGIPINKAKL
jgi:catalase